QCREPGRLESGARLDERVALERRLGLRWLVVRRHVDQPDNLYLGDEGGEDPLQLSDLAWVARRQEDLGHDASALRCSSASSAHPFAARESSASSSSRPNGSASAVPCTSTKRPSPVMTTFMSVSARTSSSYG